MCYPNNCISPSYYASPYSFSKFVSLRFFASRNSCMGAAVSLFMLSAQSTKFSKCVTSQAGIMSSPIHHPDVRLPVSPVSSFNRIIRGQGVLLNRAAVPTAISPETLHKFNLKKHRSGLHTAKIKIGFAQH